MLVTALNEFPSRRPTAGLDAKRATCEVRVVRYLPPLALLVFASSLPAADELLPRPSVAIDTRSLPSVPADELRPLPCSTDIFGDVYKPVRRREAKVVRNSRYRVVDTIAG
jgi:hypothetical protein